MLVLLAAKKTNPYEWFVTLNHQTENWNVKSYSTILECESAVRIQQNSDDNLLQSVREAVNAIYCLEVG